MFWRTYFRLARTLGRDLMVLAFVFAQAIVLSCNAHPWLSTWQSRVHSWETLFYQMSQTSPHNDLSLQSWVFFSLMLIWPLKYIDLNCQFTMVCMSFLSNMIVNFSVQALFPIFLIALMFCHFRYSDMFIKLVPTSLACPVWTSGKNKGSKKCYQWTKPSQNEILIWQVNELKLWVRNVISDLMKNCY